MGQVINSVCLCACLCPHSRSHISLSVVSKSGTEVSDNPKSKNEFIRGSTSHHPFPYFAPKTHFEPKGPENQCKYKCTNFSLKLEFGRCTHRTSKIGDIGACWNTDVDVVKIEFARGGICSGSKTTALNSDVKTRFFFENRPPTAVNSTTNHCPCPGYRRFPHTHPPRTSQTCVYSYNPGGKQTSIL